MSFKKVDKTDKIYWFFTIRTGLDTREWDNDGVSGGAYIEIVI